MNSKPVSVMWSVRVYWKAETMTSFLPPHRALRLSFYSVLFHPNVLYPDRGQHLARGHLRWVRESEIEWVYGLVHSVTRTCVCVCVRMAAIERPMNSTWRSFHYRRLWSLNNTLYRDTFTTGRSSSQLLLRLHYPDLRPVSLQSFVLFVGWQRSRTEMRSRASKQAKS